MTLSCARFIVLGVWDPKEPARGMSAQCVVTWPVRVSDLCLLASAAPLLRVNRPHYIFRNRNEFSFFSLNTMAIYTWGSCFKGPDPLADCVTFDPCCHSNVKNTGDSGPVKQ